MDQRYQRRKERRTDLETISSPGRMPDEGPSEVIRHRIKDNPDLSAHKIAYSFRIPTSTVCRYLQYILGIKCYSIRWIPHMLTVAQKVAREEAAKTTLEILAGCAASNLHLRFLFIRDESWLLYGYMPITSEPCGYSVLKMLTSLNGPQVSPTKQWQLCSSIEQGCI
jgi:hypothetical protein